jgi:hypothetical protein
MTFHFGGRPKTVFTKTVFTKTVFTAPPDSSPNSSRGSKGSPSGETLEIASYGTVQNAPLRDAVDSVEGAGNLAYAAANPAHIPPVSASTKRTNAAGPLMPLRTPRARTLSNAFILPILGFFSILVLTSIALRSSDTLASKFIKTTLPGALQAAPSELFIKNSRFQKVTLDNGEVVRVISGTIVNTGQRNFLDVQIEVATFNGAGKPLGSVRANAGATLAKTKVPSLTSEMIEELQKSSGSHRLVIKPGDKKDFAIALLGDEYSSSKHFAARIYSAKSF